MRTKHLSLVLFIIVVYTNTVMANYSLEDVQRITQGKGVFYVTVNNNGKHKVTVGVNVDLLKRPEGYEEKTIGFATVVSIEAYSSTKALFLKPLIDDFPDYIGTGPELPADSQVKVSLSRGGRLPLRQFYPANYIPGTKIIEVPDVTFDVDFG